MAKEHDWKWHEQFLFTACTKCGIVRRDDGKNKPCKGVVKIALRESKQMSEELKACREVFRRDVKEIAGLTIDENTATITLKPDTLMQLWQSARSHADTQLAEALNVIEGLVSNIQQFTNDVMTLDIGEELLGYCTEAENKTAALRQAAGDGEGK